MSSIEQYSGHSYIRTYSGVKFPVFNPSVEDVENKDIIGVLPRIPRFGGHTNRVVSVAEHTLLVRRLAIANGASQDIIDACLLHDFSEVYLCDLPSPYKNIFPAYKDLEEDIQKVIYQRYNCPRKKDEVRSYDIAALHIEAHRFMSNVVEDWGADLSEVLPAGFVVVQPSRFWVPQIYVRMKLKKLLTDLCKRRLEIGV